jgi:hypothetical protein
MARMDWCVQPRNGANHPPVAVVNGISGVSIVHVSGRPGQLMTLSAEGSTDPDGDALRPRWWIYPEAGTYTGSVEVHNADTFDAQVKLPADARGATIHVILSLQDTGIPPLTRYRRAIIAITDH